LKSVRKTINIKYYKLCVCSLIYSAYNAHAPYYIHIFGLPPLYHIFAPFLINGKIFGKQSFEHKMGVLLLYTNFV
jgi:hypothetical protein